MAQDIQQDPQQQRTAAQEQLDTEAKLWALWRGLLDTFLRYLAEMPPHKRRASTLDVMLKFLRLNNVSINTRTPDPFRDAFSRLDKIDLPFPVTATTKETEE